MRTLSHQTKVNSDAIFLIVQYYLITFAVILVGNLTFHSGVLIHS